MKVRLCVVLASKLYRKRCRQKENESHSSKVGVAETEVENQGEPTRGIKPSAAVSVSEQCYPYATVAAATATAHS